jgi:tetratricopeptide (TPR) repeat protein
VTPEEKVRMASARPVDPEVYEACLRAQFQLDSHRYKEAWEYIQEAIKKDPTYAPAHYVLASYYTSHIWRTTADPQDVFPEARAAANKALELDETLADAHRVKAFIQYAHDWDWSGAERHYRRALELNPGLFRTHSSYSLFLNQMRRHEEAIAEAKRAQELNPLSWGPKVNLGVILRSAGRYEEAIEQLQETIEMFPDNGQAYYQLGVAYSLRGMQEEAFAAYHEANALPGAENMRTRASLASAYARSGRRDEARKILGELLDLEKQSYVSPWAIAIVYVSLEEKEQALQWFEKAYEVRDENMSSLSTLQDVFPDHIWDDPRFQDLLRRMNFPE